MHSRAPLLIVLAVTLMGCKSNPEQPVRAAHAEPSGFAGELDGRIDLCGLKGSEKPADLLPKYAENKYDSTWLLTGKVMFFDKLAGFRCGNFKLSDGTGSGAYSTDNVTFMTSQDESSIRLVRITLGTATQMKALSDMLTTQYGAGKIVNSNRKTKGERSFGEEVRLLESGTHNIYLDTIYMGESQVGSIAILRTDDDDANKKLVADMNASKPK